MLITSLLATGVLSGIKHLGGLQPLELAAYDQMVRLQPKATADPRLLIVAITEADINTQKQWPLTDQTIAQLLAKLQQFQPAVIGLDVYRDIPHPPGQSALQQQLRASNLIVINKLGDSDSAGVAAPPAMPAQQVGFNDLLLDADKVVRRSLLFAAVDQDRYYSFGLQVSLRYLAQSNLTLKPDLQRLEIGERQFVPLDETAGGYQTIDAQGYQTLLCYRSPATLARQVTLTQVLQGQVDPAWVRGKIVLVGTTAPSAKDLFFTPYSSSNQQPLTPGVVLHTQVVSQVVNSVLDRQAQVWYWSEWVEVLWIGAWAVVGGTVAGYLRRPLHLSMATIAALSGLAGTCFYLFTQAGWVPLVPPMLAMLMAIGGMWGYRSLWFAAHDALTGLPNRRLFLKQLQRTIAQTAAARSQHRTAHFAVLFLDLDRFKLVNNSLGHWAGDELLVAIARRLRTLHSRHTLARVGGDEFAILVNDIEGPSAAMAIADRVHKELTRPLHLNAQEVFITASIGIALNQTDHTYQPEDLLRDAHTAMYRAKAAGTARYEVFATGMRVQIVNRLQLETDLRYAIARLPSHFNHDDATLPSEFRLHYQPIVSLTSGKIVGFEALVRWHHPQRGLVSPLEFIPIAEETDLIMPLGQWILQTACYQTRRWQTQFPTNPPLMISVNLSGKQCSQPNLVQQIKQTLQTTQLEGRSLKLEITESVAMEDVESAIALLLQLKSLNLQLSIDDFGTGFSSLSYLHRFPADTLKVDRSFVNHMGETSEDNAIVRAIVMLGHHLNMSIVAEGVETAAQLATLRTLGCEYGQGYFFAKPLDSEAATALLTAQPHW